MLEQDPHEYFEDVLVRIEARRRAERQRRERRRALLRRLIPFGR